MLRTVAYLAAKMISMSVNQDAWMITQVQRMAKTRPERLKAILSQMRHSLPEAYEELLLTALEHGEVTLQQCAHELGLDDAEMIMRQEAYRQLVSESLESPVISHDIQGTARVTGTMIAVWEIVRRFRKTASVSELRESFPSLTELELRSALAYAGRNPDEVQGQIAAYEEVKRQSAGLAVVHLPT